MLTPFSSSTRRLAAAVSAILLSACGGGKEPSATGAVATSTASTGQVAAAAPAKSVSYYAAARFAEQATFGATPALIAELQAKGFERWIDEQLVLPPTRIDTAPALISGNPMPQAPYVHLHIEYQRLILSSADQLRARVTWSLTQFIAVALNDHPVSLIEWMNMLQRQAFGNYGDLLYEVSINAHMGGFLNNDQNRPKSGECPNCAPNENYARELMQLFSIGVQMLNPDGTAVRNAKGGPVETYTQSDVEELARVLTGWEYSTNPLEQSEATRLLNRYVLPMRPTTSPAFRDSGAKVVLGRQFPAGQSQSKDLQDAVAVLMAHQNIGPFVGLRMIQHLVKSNPTPAYVRRVASVFRNNGKGQAGDMKAVIKAVLLDEEARAGDDPTRVRRDDGKIREPALHRAAAFRGLGCRTAVSNSPDRDYRLSTQEHLNPDSVFSFYAPTDRAPGGNLLAPEQKLITTAELTQRFNDLASQRLNRTTQAYDMSAFAAAGCDSTALMKAYKTSPHAYTDYLSLAFFRGAMPPTLAQNIEQAILNPSWNTAQPEEGALRMLSFALATPYFGVIK